jgi:hypothetical protein
MFQLTDDEAATLIFQSGRSKERGGRRHNPFVFTEQGVAMLSSVLRSERAVQVNVAIVCAFVSLRRMPAGNDALSRKLAELERRLESHDQGIKSLFDAIRELMASPEKPAREMGFHVKEDSRSVSRETNDCAKTNPLVMAPTDLKESENGKKEGKSIVFTGERFDVMSVRRCREKMLADAR